jgi:hypothetical protein
VRNAIALWSDLLEKESAPSPLRTAIDALHDEAPDFLVFGEDARDLASSYPISELRTETPAALQNLADIGGLSFAELFRVVDSADGAALTTLEHRVNRRLTERFTESWQQSGVSVAVRLSTSLVEVQVVNEDSEFTALAERSDGLREFVALHSFALRNRAAAPILLIDEAEQRLHYDAQADLVQMLAKQQVAPKVIYTTHSAGCLPEDLGNGVRLVSVSDTDPTASVIANKFWAESSNGFQPLLIGMGASTLAFFPTRKAVLVEGPVDMLLYPTMFREAIELDYLGFQFVPGLSTTGQALAPLVPGESRHIAYLTDGDAGGLDIGARLRDAGVLAARIITLRNRDNTAVELEDFIDPATLLYAANKLISRGGSDPDCSADACRQNGESRGCLPGRNWQHFAKGRASLRDSSRSRRSAGHTNTRSTPSKSFQENCGKGRNVVCDLARLVIVNRESVITCVHLLLGSLEAPFRSGRRIRTNSVLSIH